MKYWQLIIFITINLLALPLSAVQKKSFSIRICAYNVECGEGGYVPGNTAEDFGRMLKPYKFDIIAFNEVPDGDWTSRVGKIVGLEYSYVGKISSANHKDKYKSILSRYPLEAKREHELKGEWSWNPGSAVRAVAKIKGQKVAIYSLHVCSQSQKNKKSHLNQLISEVLPKERTKNVLVVGDYNNKVSDGEFAKFEAAGYKTSWSDLQIDVSKLSSFPSNALRQNNEGVIDHIFINKSSKGKAVKAEVLEEKKKALSDHKPVWAEIVFPLK
ncbi:MAG: endonuclease/exonuclease/phosphatase family protein [Lentisphaerales bacterium]|nr:endonuclease/exonuclease/phosphatase family protein [Lentisphaerales bacterium]